MLPRQHGSSRSWNRRTEDRRSSICSSKYPAAITTSPRNARSTATWANPAHFDLRRYCRNIVDAQLYDIDVMHTRRAE